MSRIRFFFLGILATVVGLYWTYAALLYHAMVQASCDKVGWDDPGCARLMLRSQASIAAPVPGLIMIAISIYRFVQWRRTPIIRRLPKPEADAITTGTYR
jgi:hypothetical protein